MILEKVPAENGREKTEKKLSLRIKLYIIFITKGKFFILIIKKTVNGIYNILYT